MKRSCYGVVLVALFVLGASAALSQISLTKANVLAAYTNFRWYEIETSDSATVNLGIDVVYSQTWDFSALHGGPQTDTLYLDYFLPAGQLKAEDFPDAELSGRMIMSSSYGGYTTTMTIVNYYKTTAAGGFEIGSAMRQQIVPAPPPPTPADTTTEVHHSILGNPGFPFGSLGVKLATRDTVSPVPGMFTYTTDTMSLNGFGSATFPDGVVRQVLRMTEDRITVTYMSGFFEGREHSRSVSFIAADYTTLSFSVDSDYVHGVTLVNSYNFSKQGIVAAVRPLSRAIPENFALAQNYPNPFNPATEITFSIPKAQIVTLKIFTILGAEVATLVNQPMQPGEYSVRFDAGNLPSGLYFYRLSAGSYTQTKKMTLVR